MKEHCILIVNCEKAVRTRLKDILAASYFTLEADNAKECMRLFASEKPVDLLLLDVSSPLSGGFDMLIEAQKKEWDIPIIVTSAYGNTEEEAKAFSLGAADVLYLPLVPPLVKRRLENVLGRYDSEKKGKNQWCAAGGLEKTQEKPSPIHSMKIGMAVCNVDASYTYTFVEERLCHFFGYTKEEFMAASGGNAIGLMHPPDRERALRRSGFRGNCFYTYVREYRVMKKNGELLWVQELGQQFEDEDGVLRIRCTLMDISMLKSTIEYLHHYEKFDTLTGIYKEKTFYAETHELLMANPKKSYFIFIFDVVRFKVINDLFGMEEGDLLLQHIAYQIKQLLYQKEGTFGRLMADVFGFCLLCEDADVAGIVQHLKSRICNYPLDFEIKLGVGVYPVSNHSLPVNIMCDRCMISLKSVKGSFHRDYAIYDDSMRDIMLKEQEITNEMHIALENHEFRLFLQPKFTLDTQSIVGAEVLVRWFHPQKGMIPPGDFIPLFERNGFIVSLDRYIWEETCKMLRQWLDEGKEVHPLSVNVSRIHLYQSDFPDFIIDLVKKYQLPPKLLELEITESAYTDNLDILLKAMEQLQSYGFLILMDDFGSGYSSLNMLKDVSVDILKVDLNFLAGDDVYGRSGSILTSVVRMAKWLNIPVVVEGVETEEQLNFLRSIGCTQAQGYFFAKPMPPQDYLQLLAVNSPNLSVILAAEDLFKDFDKLWDPNSQINLLINSIIGGMGLYELDGGVLKVIRVNDSYFDILGEGDNNISPEAANIFLRVEDMDRPVFKNALEEAVENRKLTFCRIRRVLKSGDALWLQLKIHYLGNHGEKQNFLIAFSDITETRRLDYMRLLEQYDHVLSTIFKDIIELNFTKNQFRIVTSQRNMVLIDPENRTLDQLTQQLQTYIYPDDLGDFGECLMPENISRHFASHKEPIQKELRILNQSQDYTWVSVTVAPVDNGTGDRVFLCCFNNSTEKHLGEANRTLRQLLANLSAGIGIYELGDVVTRQYSNVQLGKILGYTVEEFEKLSLTGNSPFSLFPGQENAMDYQDAINTDTFVEHSFWARKKDGTPVWLWSASKFVQEYNQNPLCYTLILDRTSDKEREEYLHIQEERHRILSESYHAVLFDYNYITDTLALTCYDDAGKVEKTIKNHSKNILSSGIIREEDISMFLQIFKTARIQPTEASIEFLGNFFDNEFRWYRGYYVSVANDEGEVHHLVGNARDVTKEKNIEEKLKLEQKFRDAIFSENLVSFEYDLETGKVKIMYRNAERSGEFFPYDKYIRNGKMNLTHHEDRLKAIETFDLKYLHQAWVENTSEVKEHMRILTRDNRWVWVEMGIHFIRGKDAKGIGYIRDISESKKTELEMVTRAEIDAVTGLYNRGTLERRIRRVLVKREKVKSAFMVLDLDSFKKINDTYGHLGGDRVLRQLGNLLKSTFRENDILGRYGGDEFVIFIQNIGSQKQLHTVLQGLMDGITGISAVNHWRIPVSCSIGVSLYPNHGTTLEELLSHADDALYRGKEKGKNCYVFYDE